MKKEKNLKTELARVLHLSASSEEREFLSNMDIVLKRPTKMTVIAASLYKKAAGGELSAIKELLAVMENRGSDKVGGVTLVDDIGKSS